jgi:hypothetical protein
MKSTKNIKKRILAIPAEATAIPPNPKIAATIATIRNIKAQYSMVNSASSSGNLIADREYPFIAKGDEREN